MFVTPLNRQHKCQSLLLKHETCCLCMCVRRVFRSHQKSQRHEILGLPNLGQLKKHDEVRFFSFNFLRILWAFLVFNPFFLIMIFFSKISTETPFQPQARRGAPASRYEHYEQYTAGITKDTSPTPTHSSKEGKGNGREQWETVV